MSITAPPKTIKLTLSSSRQLVAASCSCKAGVAGKCKHAAAVAVYLEQCETLSKTSQPQAWGVPTFKKVYPKLSKTAKRHNIEATARSLSLQHVRQYFGDIKCPINELLQAEEDESCGEAPVRTETPAGNVKLFDWDCSEKEYPSYFMQDSCGKLVLKKRNFTASLSDVEAKIYEEHVAVAPENVPSLSKKTLDDKAQWKRARIPRITGTKAYRVLCCRPENIDRRARSLIFEQDFGGPTVRYGIAMEPEARRAFENEHGVEVSLFGLVVSRKESWLACSADGIFLTHENEAVLLEIKCPFSRRGQTLTTDTLLPYLQKNDALELQKKHTYYAQIQISLYALELQQCWFYVYTEADSLMIKISRDEEYLAEAIPVLREFYFAKYLTCLKEYYNT
ncbi:uncharacterized protein LOC144105051 [Amblyomma americanum]